MKAILISIQPQHVANILNGLKTLEIRKKFPSDYVGWVYIYCTKKEPYVRRYVHNDKWGTLEYIKSDGKVVARFKITNSELEIERVCVEALANGCGGYEYQYYGGSTGIDVREKSCLDEFDLTQYLGIGKEGIPLGYAIHVTNLEIFDKPKEISEFQGTCNKSCEANRLNVCKIKPYCNKPLTRAPQSWCYIEV